MQKYQIINLNNFLLILLVIYIQINIYQQKQQKKPIIGILTQPSGFTHYPEDDYSYIFTSYVDYFELNDTAQTIFIKYTWSEQKISQILDQINGVVIPGGGSNLFFKDFGQKKYTDFALKGKFIIEQVILKNQKGNYFPLYGVCLGFELMAIVFANNDHQILQSREGKNHLGNIQIFEDQIIQSKTFKNFTDYKTLDFIQKNSVLFYNHKFGIQYEDFQNKYKLTNEFRVLALSHDIQGKNFISMMEHKQYPLYAVQFHPEKNKYDFDPSLPINHGKAGVKFTDYMANFFIEETKQNKQQFKNQTLLNNYILKNHSFQNIKSYTMGVYFLNSKIDNQSTLIDQNIQSSNQQQLNDNNNKNYQNKIKKEDDINKQQLNNQKNTNLKNQIPYIQVDESEQYKNNNNNLNNPQQNIDKNQNNQDNNVQKNNDDNINDNQQKQNLNKNKQQKNKNLKSKNQNNILFCIIILVLVFIILLSKQLKVTKITKILFTYFNQQIKINNQQQQQQNILNKNIKDLKISKNYETNYKKLQNYEL